MIKNLLIIFLILSYPGFCQEEKVDYYSIEKRKDFEKLDEIKNNILKSLFFRGEVADSIIESNLVGKITDRQFGSYAEMRDYLIQWIGQNPDKAAALYSFRNKEGKINIPTEVKYFVPYYEINPYFKELIENLEKISKDYSLTDEELRLGALRLFEGEIDYGQGRIDINGRPVDGNTYESKNISLVNYAVNISALTQEAENIKSIYNAFVSELKKINSPSLLNKKGLLDKKYLEFSLFIADIKGRKNLSEKEAINLENLRKDIRRYFISIKLLIFASDLKKIIQNMPDGVLKYDIEKFIKLLETESENSLKEENLSMAYTFLKQSFEIYKTFKKELFFWQETSKIISESYIGFSCFYDYLSFLVLKIFPENVYFQKRKEILENVEFLKEIEKKSLERKIVYLNQEELEKINKKLLEMKRNIEIVKKISEINRRQQFFMWEIFFPFGVKKENGRNFLFLNIIDAKILPFRN